MNPRPADDDRALLQAFCEERSEAAFRRLVDRYAGLVLGTALRVTENREIAEEVSQSVFTVLARRAATVDGTGGLAGWLHRVAWYEAVNARRTEQRHRRKMKKLSRDQLEAGAARRAEESENWNASLPHLDEALQRLPDRDRRTVMLHFFEGLTFAEIASRLGGSPDAAQKRGSRALRKLERRLRLRGCGLTAAALASGLGGQLAKAAPDAAFTANLTTQALAAAPAVTTGASLTNLFILMKSAKLGIAAAVALTALLFTPVVMQRQAIAHTEARIAELVHDNAVLESQLHGDTTQNFGRLATTGRRPAETENSIDLAKLLEDIEAATRGSMMAELRVLRTLNSLDSDELAALAESIPSLNLVEKRAGLLAGYLIQDLVQKDPEMAARVGLSLLAQFTGWEPRFQLAQVAGWGLRDWAKEDPAAALAWYRDADARGEFEDSDLMARGALRRSFAEGLFTGLFTTDRQSASALLESLDPSMAAHVLARAGFSAKTDADRRVIAEAALTIDNAHETIFAFNGLVASLRNDGLDAAADFLKSLQLEPWFEAELLAVAADPVRNRHDRAEVDKALAWLEENVPEDHVGHAQGKLLGMILINEPSAVMEALEALRMRRPHDDHLVIEFLNIARATELGIDPLVNLALQVGDDEAREAAIRSIFEHRPGGEEAALHAALEKAGVRVHATLLEPDTPTRKK